MEIESQGFEEVRRGVLRVERDGSIGFGYGLFDERVRTGSVVGGSGPVEELSAFDEVALGLGGRTVSVAELGEELLRDAV